MTDIEKRALALLNEVRTDCGFGLITWFDREEDIDREALCRAIEQHEAFRREVSDAVEVCQTYAAASFIKERLSRFIIPKPVDPLVDALREVTNDGNPATMAAWQKEADTLREAMKARGYEWTKIEDHNGACRLADHLK